MKNFTARVADVASMALGALPVAALSAGALIALTTAAHAQERVQVRDLNMASASGKAAFSERVDTAARHFCRTERNLTLRNACQAAVRAEANEKAASSVQYASRL
jgi:UrcA family protein